MYNVLIVDDEHFVRMSLKNIIPWEKYDLNIGFEASDGEKAIEIIRNNKIDILITDIEMPRIGGIELLERIKADNIDIEIIVISCHDQYDYVRKSMKLGAYDYFFKPTMFPEDFLRILLEVKNRVEAKVKIRSLINDYRIRNEVKDIKSFGDLFLLMYNNKVNDEEKNDPNGFFLSMIKFCEYEKVFAKFEGDQNIIDFALQNVVSEVLSKHPDFYFLKLNNNEYVIFVLMSGKATDIFQIIRRLCTEISENLTKIFGDVTIASSDYKESINDLLGAYIEVNTLLDKSRTAVRSGIIYYDEMKVTKPRAILSDLFEDICALEVDTLKLNMKDIFYNHINKEGILIEEVKELAIHIISTVIKKNNISSVQLSKLLSDQPKIYTKVYTFNTVEEIVEYLIATMQTVELSKGHDIRVEMYHAEQFINEHFANYDMSLELVAQHVNMSKSYFSKMFKNTFNKTFVEYLTEIRLDKAEELYSQNNNMKVYQIAEKVGYTDCRYFGKLFKERRGKYISSIKK
ncbi:MAG: response regulator [Vallitaleaceae bacterium]|nr:response regulator [Vallitaleaceae bacterium]